MAAFSRNAAKMSQRTSDLLALSNVINRRSARASLTGQGMCVFPTANDFDHFVEDVAMALDVSNALDDEHWKQPIETEFGTLYHDTPYRIVLKNGTVLRQVTLLRVRTYGNHTEFEYQHKSDRTGSKAHYEIAAIVPA